MDQLDEAIDRASLFIASKMTASGRFAGGCEARPLETGLFLHVLQEIDARIPAVDALAAYCRRYIEASHPRRGNLDEVISALLCRRVLGEEVTALGSARLDAALAHFDHPTQARKLLLFKVLFAELGATPPPSINIPRDAAHQPGNQLWVSVILTALRILLAHLQGRPDDIDPAEVEFIVAHQADDGGWEHHVLATLVALLALHRAGADPSAIARGVFYVLRQVRADGGVPFIADEDVWVTCLSGLVLREARPSTCDLNTVARYVAALQRDDGGWGFAEGVQQTDADDTSVALTLLTRHDRIGHRAAIRRAQWYLLALQNDDGGFPTFVRGAASEAEITAKAILALRLSSEGCFAGRIDRAWRWLGKAQRADGSFRAEWKLGSSYPALHVLSAAALCASTPTIERVRAGALAYLRKSRRPSGGWSLSPGSDEIHLLSTAYSIAGLASDRHGLDRIELSHSVALLLDMQASDGGFYGSGDSLGPRPFVYDVPLLASVYALLALSRSRRALTRQIRGGLEHREVQLSPTGTFRR
ncbi:MAG: terpene cyclase/mutase family protein [Myxococcales bacterium]|nr:terpene cyclase/mutase family protein [Myxococcales bacterium]